VYTSVSAGKFTDVLFVLLGPVSILFPIVTFVAGIPFVLFLATFSGVRPQS